jgi:hypothetical protein
VSGRSSRRWSEPQSLGITSGILTSGKKRSDSRKRPLRLTLRTPAVGLDPTKPIEYPIQRVTIYDGDLLIKEIYFTYFLYLNDSVTFTVKTPWLPSGYGKQWSPEYRICMGLPPYGFSRVSYSYAVSGYWNREYPQRCTPDENPGWITCSIEETAETGLCLKFSVQGHDGGGCFLCDDPLKKSLSVEAGLTTTYRLVTSHPK